MSARSVFAPKFRPFRSQPSTPNESPGISRKSSPERSNFHSATTPSSQDINREISTLLKRRSETLQSKELEELDLAGISSYRRISNMSFKNLSTSSVKQCVMIGKKSHVAQVLYYQNTPYILIANYPETMNKKKIFNRLPCLDPGEGDLPVGHISLALFTTLMIDSLLEIRQANKDELNLTHLSFPEKYGDFLKRIEETNEVKLGQFWGHSKLLQDLKPFDLVVKEEKESSQNNRESCSSCAIC